MTVVDIKIPPETFAQEAKTGRMIVKKAKMMTRLAKAATRPISRRTKAETLFPASDSVAVISSDMFLFSLLVNCR
jgi:hypothetical protein